MTEQFPTASPVETVLFNALQVLPNSLSGLFRKREPFVGLFSRLNTDRLVVALLSQMAQKYGTEAVWTKALADTSLLVLGAEATKEVLERSPADFASDPKAKRQGMGHFQPDALTISRGADWEERRRFNEAVLASNERIHPLAARMLEVVHNEVSRTLGGVHDRPLVWPDMETLFEKITLRVIFGDAARDDHALVELLDAMMAEANRVVGLTGSVHLEPFHERVSKYIAEAEPGSLVSRFAGAGYDDRTAVAGQVTHWMFAMKDTLAANVFRALAVIVANPGVEEQVRTELASASPGDPGAVDALRYLEGCLEEAMRLWPTTAMFGRETLADTTLAGGAVPAGSQVLIVNTFNHRNTALVPDADLFHPERWAGGPSYQFNHLSNGPQHCAGLWMVLFLGKAVLAELLSAARYVPDAPTGIETARPVPYMLDFFKLRFRIAS